VQRRRQYSEPVAAELFQPLSRDSMVLLHDQIVDRVVNLLAAGRLRRGAYLPAIKFMAAKLGVSHGTVSRAYEHLAVRGVAAASSTRGVQLLVGSTEGEARAVPWAPPVMQPVRPVDPLALPARRGATRGTISFDRSECGDELTPTALINRSLQSAAPGMLGYPPLTALPQCVDAVETYLRDRGVRLQGGALLLTSGTTQSLAIAARALAPPGAVVLTEHPTWHVALAVFGAAGLRVVGVPIDDSGLQTETLADTILRHSPAFMYLQPAFQNPTGISLTPERRRQLLDIARRLHVPVIEDDFASELAFDVPLRPLRSNDAEDVVIYLKSFAKVLAPALRVGVIITPTRYERLLREAQHGIDPFVSVLAQRVITACLGAKEEFSQHLTLLAKTLRGRWRSLSTALETYMPSGTRWAIPRGGLCTWVEFPSPVRTVDLLDDLAVRGVSVTPGTLFCLNPGGERSARVAFGTTPDEAISRGIEQLAEVVRLHLRIRRPAVATFRGVAP